MGRKSFLLVIAITLGASLYAQSKPAPQPADYGKWESLVVPQRSGLSPDGKWIAYGLNRANGENDLRISSGAGRSPEKVIAFGTQSAFSSDSHWVAYSIGYSETAADKLRRDRKPVQNKLGLLNLANGEQVTIDNIQSFAFSPNGAW